MTKKERMKLPLLAVALFAHAEAARERGTDAAAYVEHLVNDFALGIEEIECLSRLAAFGRVDLFVRCVDGVHTSPRERLLNLTGHEIAAVRYPNSWAKLTPAEQAQTLEEVGKLLHIIRTLAGVA